MKLKFVICSLLVMTSNAIASDVANLTEKLQNCATLTEDRKRLTCFDNLALALKPKISTVTETVKQQTAKTVEHKKATSTAAVASKSIPAKQSTHEQARIDSFGEEHLAKTQEQLEEEEKSVVFTVKSVEKNAHKQLIITFENGQRWKQSDSSYLSLRPGNRVELKKGVFDVVFLNKVDKGRKIKVKRIK